MTPAARIGNALGLITLTVLPACGALSGGNSTLALVSRAGESSVSPAFSTSIYAYHDSNTLDVYLTDLPMDQLMAAAEGRLDSPLPPGSLVRVHLFLNPRAGYTPIDYTASNATFTYMIVSGEVFGVYSGAGFVLPSSTPGEPSFSARTSGANLRLAGATPGFNDRLGPAELSGRISAARDDARAEKLGGLFSAMARFATRDAPPPSDPSASLPSQP